MSLRPRGPVTPEARGARGGRRRAAPERDRPAVQLGEVADDREPEPGAGLRLVRPRTRAPRACASRRAILRRGVRGGLARTSCSSLLRGRRHRPRSARSRRSPPEPSRATALLAGSSSSSAPAPRRSGRGRVDRRPVAVAGLPPDARRPRRLIGRARDRAGLLLAEPGAATMRPCRPSTSVVPAFKAGAHDFYDACERTARSAPSPSPTDGGSG